MYHCTIVPFGKIKGPHPVPPKGRGATRDRRERGEENGENEGNEGKEGTKTERTERTKERGKEDSLLDCNKDPQDINLTSLPTLPRSLAP